MDAPEPLTVKLSTLVSVTERAKKAEAEVERLRTALCDLAPHIAKSGREIFHAALRTETGHDPSCAVFVPRPAEDSMDCDCRAATREVK